MQELNECFSREVYEQMNLRNLISANIPEALENTAFDQLQDEFSSMMPRYIELHSKLEFLRELFSIQDIDQLNKYSMGERNDTVEESKQELRKCKQSCAVDEKKIHRYLENVSQMSTSLKELQANNSRQEKLLLAKRAELKQKQALNREKREQLERCIHSSIPSLSESERLLERQTGSIQNLNNKKAQLEESVLDAANYVREMQKQLAESEEKAAAIETNDVLTQNSRELGRMENIRKWYASMTEIAQTLSGFSIVRIGTNDIEISILGRYTVTIKFVDGSYAVERLTVIPDDIELDDISDCRDLRPLLLELRARVRSRLRRESLNTGTSNNT